MQAKYEIVIADATCFILLDKIGELEILRALFGKIVTTHVIAAEFGYPLPEWVEIREVKKDSFQFTLDIDAGEASAIALAMESGLSLLVLDDDKARKAAKRLNLKFTGTLGLLLSAKNAGIIPTVKSILDKIEKTNFWYSDTLMNEILKNAGE